MHFYFYRNAFSQLHSGEYGGTHILLTFFEVRVSSYAVHQANMECEERNQDISFSQLKVPSASRRVLLTRLISLLSPPGRDQDGHHLPR
jgi:hypothetical protein